jgi:hypothetical protein
VVYKGIDATPKQKQNTRRSKLNKRCIVLKKQKFEDLQTEIFVDVDGWWGHRQDYFIDRPYVLLGLTWLHSPMKKCHYINFSHSFSAGLD